MTSRIPLAIVLATGALAGTSTSALAAVPDAFTATPCATVVGSQQCGSRGPGININAFADLATLTAGANIDLNVANRALTYANAYYFVELFSSSGAFSPGTVPILVSAAGTTDVGDSTPPASGTPFNHNFASASVKAFDYNFYACTGWQCPGWAARSFSGGVQLNVQPGSSGSGVGVNIWRIEVSARAETNSNYLSSFAHAWADPVIGIEPAYAAAHPEISLNFSANAVPEPSALLLMLGGLAALAPVVRRLRPRGRHPFRRTAAAIAA